MDKKTKSSVLIFEGRQHLVPGLASYGELVAAASSVFGVPANAVELSYEDDEKDLVAMKSDMELRELHRMGGTQFAIKVTRKPGHNNPPTLNSMSQSENETLAQVQAQLKLIGSTIAALESARVESNKKLKESSHYEGQLQALQDQVRDLEIQLGRSEDDNKASQHKIAELKREMQNKDTEIEQKSALLAQVTRDAANNKDATAKMGEQLLMKMREVTELKKERDGKTFEHEKTKAILASLEKEVAKTREENLQLSKVYNTVQAEREVLEKTAQDLMKKLEQESLEKETLQHSILLGGNHPTHTEPYPPPLVYSPTTDDDQIEYRKTTEADWKNELDVMSSLGYADRKKNLELLVEHQDMAKAVSYLKTSSSVVLQRNIPPGIDQVDILMLENMGFVDFEQNIELLKKHKTIDAALAALLN